MVKFRKNLNWMYFGGIRDGKITTLFFDEACFQGAKRGDLISFDFLDSSVKKYFKFAKLVTFKDITEDEVKSAGFLTKELLAAHLADIYNFSIIPIGDYSSYLDSKLFYMVTFSDDIDEDNSSFSIDYTVQMYNPEYDLKIWWCNYE